MAKPETDPPTAENTVRLKAHPELEGVSIYFCAADDHYYYSRNGKRFSPKGGTSTHGCAEYSAEEAYVKAQAAKRVAPEIRMCVFAPEGKKGIGLRTRSPQILGPGHCRGYGLQSGREGLVFESDPVPSRYPHRPPETETSYVKAGGYVSDAVRAFHPDDPAIEQIKVLTKRHEDAEKRAKMLETMRDDLVNATGLRLPSKPESKDKRVRVEEELVEVCSAIAKPPPARTFKFHIADDLGAYDKIDIPKRFSNVRATSAWDAIASDPALKDGIWNVQWSSDEDGYESRYNKHWGERFPGEVVRCFKRYGMPKVRLVMRDTKPHLVQPDE